MFLFYLIIPTLVYSFQNIPIHLYSKNINSVNNVKIIEPIEINNKDTPSFLFFSGLSGKIPNEIYNNFLNYISSSGISCFIINDDIHNCKKILNYMQDNYANVTIGGHSSGGAKAIKLISESLEINNLILFDPVDDRIIDNNKVSYLYNTFFDKSQNEIEIKNIQNYLLVKAENSYKWKFFPPQMPFIPLFDINENTININDNIFIIKDENEEIFDNDDEMIKVKKTITKKINVNKKSFEIKNFGHTDLLDEYWAKNMRKLINDYNEEKTFDELNTYHKLNAYLVNQICYNQISDLKSNMENNDNFKNIKYNIHDI